MPISAPKIPEGLPELMRGLAKSVIKENPENLYVHAAEYFENLIRERDGELERGYQTFNAYQVYADYRERGREKLGLTRADGSSISDGEAGDESGSGGSGTKSRGRRRARRARKQSSREKDNPPTMVEQPASGGTEAEAQKLNSLSEEGAPVPVVEQEVVKVHYNPPEAPPVARVVSAQSVEAEQAVSSVLDDEQILDSDGTGGSKDTGDELVDHGDDVGTAPSTAEITEPRPPVGENGAMALQDMETCFMHANVDDLLEKHPEEQPAVGDDSQTAAGEAKILDDAEGEDIPEGPQMVGQPNETLNAPAPATAEATELEENDDAKEIVDNGEKLENESENVQPLEENTSPPAKETDDVDDHAEENAPEKQVEQVERTKSSDSEVVPASDNVDGDTQKPLEDVQERPEPVEEIVEKVTVHSDETVPSDVAETEDKADLPSEEVEKSNHEEPRTVSPLEDKPDSVLNAASGIETDEMQKEQIAAETGEKQAEEIEAAAETGSDPQQIAQPVNIASRMGFEEDETGDDADRKIEPKAESDEGSVEKMAEKIEEFARENSLKSNEEETVESQSREEKNNEEVNEEISESKTIEQTEHQVPGDNMLTAEDGQLQASDESNEVGESLAKPDTQPLEENASDQEPIANDGKETVDDEKEIVPETEVPPSTVTTPTGVEPVEETVEAVHQDEVQFATKPEESEIVPETPIAEEGDGEGGVDKPSEDVAPKLEKEDTKEGNDITSALPSPTADGNDDQSSEDAAAQDPEKDITESKGANDENLNSTTDEKGDQPREPSTDQGEVEGEPLKDQPDQQETGSPTEGQASDDLVHADDSVEKSPEKAASVDDVAEEKSSVEKSAEKAESVDDVAEEKSSVDKSAGKAESVDGVVEVDPEEKTIEAEQENEPPSIEKASQEASKVEMEKEESDSQEKGNESVDDEPNHEEVDPKQTSPEGLTLQNVVLDTLPRLLESGTGENMDKNDAENVDKKSATSSQESTDKEKVAEGLVEGSAGGNPEGNEEPASIETGPEQQGDAIEGSAQLADEPSPGAAPEANVEPGSEKSNESPVASAEKEELESADKGKGSEDEVNEEPCVKRDKREASLEEVVEEPCVKRQITPSKSARPDADDAGDRQVEELEEIKKVDLSQLSKDSAEALFYSLKKSELENQEPEGSVEPAEDAASPGSNADDDDKDVVVAEEPPEAPATDAGTKRTFTDDFLDEGPITEDQPADTAPSDGVQQQQQQQQQQQDPATARSSSEAGEQEDEFNPMVMVSMRSKQFQEQLHSRDEAEHGDGQEELTPKRPLMRRCMTEMTGLQRYDTTVDEDPADVRAFDPPYVEEEDQFDGYYIGHIKNKILASSVSVADSDYFDPAQSAEEPVDENNVRTALETIASTDTESTIASQATIQQAGKRSYLRKHSQNTSANVPYASFGNAAIDKSLDEFIEREERNKQDEAMAEAATKIQRSYRTHKKRLLRDYHSTMRTFTEDQSAESGEESAANVIQIKLDQKRIDGGGSPAADGDGAGEESDSPAGGLHPHQPLGTGGKRPMYSLNIDEYDTVARRMTLTRGVALQRNSTPDDDSGKSANASTDRKPPESVPASSGSGEGQGQPARSTSSDEKSEEPATVPEPSAPGSSSGEQEEHKQEGTQGSSRSRPHRTAPAATGREPEHGPVPKGAGRTTIAPLDVQSLLLIARQRTMPVQIDSSLIRVLPKHMRKRISSAGMLNGAGKRKS